MIFQLAGRHAFHMGDFAVDVERHGYSVTKEKSCAADCHDILDFLFEFSARINQEVSANRFEWRYRSK